MTGENGYELTLFRIPSNKANAQAIYLQHGILCTSSSFLLNGGDGSLRKVFFENGIFDKRIYKSSFLAYILSDLGYDVWMGNTRGTRYSRNHKTLETYNLEYWDFR